MTTKETVKTSDAPQVPRSLFESQFCGPGWPDEFGTWIAKWSQRELRAPIRTLSLFTGAGGLDIGFHQAGFHAVEMVESDERFVATLEANCGFFGMFQGTLPSAWTFDNNFLAIHF